MFKSILSFFTKVPKKYLMVLLIILAVAGFIFYSRGKNQPKVEYVSTKKQDLKVEVSTSGVLTGKNSALLHFKTAGELSYLNVKVGDSVFAGQTLAGEDTQDLAIALQQAQNNLRAQQANTEKTLDDIHLFQYGNGGFGNVGTGNETETLKNNRTATEVTRDNAVDSIKSALRAFQDTVITAPYQGVVTQADFLPGQFVLSSDTIAKIVDFSQIYFDADIDEADISKITLGQRSQVSLNAYGDRVFPGVVSEIIPRTKTTSNGATVVTVRVLLDDQSIQKIDGLNGQVTITIRELPNVLAIPQEALKSDGTVLVKTDQDYRPVKVTTGERSDNDIQVISGLKEGEQIVKNPSSLPVSFGRPGIGRVLGF